LNILQSKILFVRSIPLKIYLEEADSQLALLVLIHYQTLVKLHRIHHLVDHLVDDLVANGSMVRQNQKLCHYVTTFLQLISDLPFFVVL